MSKSRPTARSFLLLFLLGSPGLLPPGRAAEPSGGTLWSFDSHG
jgi:hypothetical protein